MCRVPSDPRATWVPKARSARPAFRANLVPRANRAPWDPRAKWDLLALKENLVLKGNRAPWGSKARWVRRARRAIRVIPDPRALPVNPVPKVIPDPRVIPDLRVSAANAVRRGCCSTRATKRAAEAALFARASPARPVPLDRLARKVRWDRWVHPAPRGLPAFRVMRVRMALPARWARPAPWGFRGPGGRRASPACWANVAPPARVGRVVKKENRARPDPRGRRDRKDPRGRGCLGAVIPKRRRSS